MKYVCTRSHATAYVHSFIINYVEVKCVRTKVQIILINILAPILLQYKLMIDGIFTMFAVSRMKIFLLFFYFKLDKRWKLWIILCTYTLFYFQRCEIRFRKIIDQYLICNILYQFFLVNHGMYTFEKFE